MAAVNRDVARKIMGDAPGDKQFYCSDGKVFKNLAELASGLREMNDGTFGYHSNPSKTDFSNWVKDVLGDEELARSLKSVSRAKAAKTVADRIVQLQEIPDKPPARAAATRRARS
jgi:hypothetical protein